MKTGTSATGVGAVFVVWLLTKIGVHLNPEEAAAGAAGVTGGVAWFLHHGGIDGLLKIIKGGKP